MTIHSSEAEASAGHSPCAKCGESYFHHGCRPRIGCVDYMPNATATAETIVTAAELLAQGWAGLAFEVLLGATSGPQEVRIAKLAKRPGGLRS